MNFCDRLFNQILHESVKKINPEQAYPVIIDSLKQTYDENLDSINAIQKRPQYWIGNDHFDETLLRKYSNSIFGKKLKKGEKLPPRPQAIPKDGIVQDTYVALNRLNELYSSIEGRIKEIALAGSFDGGNQDITKSLISAMFASDIRTPYAKDMNDFWNKIANSTDAIFKVNLMKMIQPTGATRGKKSPQQLTSFTINAPFVKTEALNNVTGPSGGFPIYDLNRLPMYMALSSIAKLSKINKNIDFSQFAKDIRTFFTHKKGKIKSDDMQAVLGYLDTLQTPEPRANAEKWKTNIPDPSSHTSSKHKTEGSPFMPDVKKSDINSAEKATTKL